MHKFLISNKGVGPVGSEVKIEKIKKGDIAQLSFSNNIFSHSLVIIDVLNHTLDGILVATHTYDSYARRISTYSFEKIRFINIEKVMIW